MNRTIIAVLLLGIAAYLGFQKFNGGTNSPSDNISKAGAAIVSVKVPELNYDAKLGETAFNKNCSACHGENAAGQEGVAPPLVHKIYEPSHHGDMAFIIAAKRGVRQHHWRFGNMPALPDVSEIEIQKIIEYIRTLQRANGIN